jgi:predicted ABC-type ATPase
MEPPPARANVANLQVVVIAGPNGAGKSTLAPELVRDAFHVRTFVNADEIARGLSGFAPGRAAIAAGHIMVDRMWELIDARSDFAFETTLAGRGTERVVQRCRASAYDIHLVYLWLASAEIAHARVRARVETGGHDVPEAVIRRRLRRGLHAFVHRLRPLVTRWRVYDANGGGVQPIVAEGEGRDTPRVMAPESWALLLRQSESDTNQEENDEA